MPTGSFALFFLYIFLFREPFVCEFGLILLRLRVAVNMSNKLMSRYQLKIAMSTLLEKTVLLYKSLTLLSQTLHSSQTEKEKEMLNMKIRRTCFMTALHVSALPSPKYFLKCK